MVEEFYKQKYLKYKKKYINLKNALYIGGNENYIIDNATIYFFSKKHFNNLGYDINKVKTSLNDIDTIMKKIDAIRIINGLSNIITKNNKKISLNKRFKIYNSDEDYKTSLNERIQYGINDILPTIKNIKEYSDYDGYILLGKNVNQENVYLTGNL